MFFTYTSLPVPCCKFSGIRHIGSDWEHNNQMGCYVLDSRWLCGKYELNLTSYVLVSFINKGSIK